MDEVERHRVRLRLNGRDEDVIVDGRETLLETLRDRFQLTSVRGACAVGVCGTCTVLTGGRPVSSCITLTAQHDGGEIVTSEGLVGANGTLDDVQDAFVAHGAYQCSYCIPGMVLTVWALLRDHPNPTEDEVRRYLSGNLCRCGTYPQILEAVASLVAAEDPSPPG